MDSVEYTFNAHLPMRKVRGMNVCGSLIGYCLNSYNIPEDSNKVRILVLFTTAPFEQTGISKIRLNRQRVR